MTGRESEVQEKARQVKKEAAEEEKKKIVQ